MIVPGIRGEHHVRITGEYDIERRRSQSHATNGSRCRVVRCAGRAVQLMVPLSCGRGRGENIK
ncbi:hypothetical protein NUKP24_44980 [Klebsiella variicola]|nr:hypothetical protein NUKP24_44980 [Klebsiella variicola]